MEIEQPSRLELESRFEQHFAIFRFVLQINCKSYTLYGARTESARLYNVLQKRNLSKVDLKQALNQIEEPVAAILRLSNINASGKLMKLMKLSCLLLLAFLTLTVIEAYFVFSKTLQAIYCFVGAVWIALQAVIVAWSYPWVKPKAKHNGREKLFQCVIDAVSSVNREYCLRGLEWEIEEGTLTLTLRDVLLNGAQIPYTSLNHVSLTLTNPVLRPDNGILSDLEIKSSKQFQALQQMLDSKNELIRKLRCELELTRRGSRSSLSDSSVLLE